MTDHVAVPENEGSMTLRPVIESLSQETMHLNRARLLNAEELEAITSFLQDMRDRLASLERGEMNAGDRALPQHASLELSGMVKMLRTDLELVRQRTSV